MCMYMHGIYLCTRVYTLHVCVRYILHHATYTTNATYRNVIKYTFDGYIQYSKQVVWYDLAYPRFLKWYNTAEKKILEN